MSISNYFTNPSVTAHRKYEALRAFLVDGVPAKEVASKFGYTYRAFTSIVTDFRRTYKNKLFVDPFFIVPKKGRKTKLASDDDLGRLMIELRKKNYSTSDIKVFLDATGKDVSERFISMFLQKEGFARLPRRQRQTREQLTAVKIEAPRSITLEPQALRFKTNTGILTFLPYIRHYGLDEIIEHSGFPQTKTIGRLSSILSFLALKLSNIRRYSTDDLWCMDRGLGLFAGLNVLPKTAWFSSYSSRVTQQMNMEFLRALHKKWDQAGLLGDTCNLDFTTVPYWGDDSHLENNWSGKRTKALASMLCVLAQQPHSGIIDYGNMDVLHKDQSAVILEFLDFYKMAGGSAREGLKYLVFDSKFTNYENLSKLNDEQVKFVTIRRRGKNIVRELDGLAAGSWKTIRVEAAGMKKRTLQICDRQIFLKGYNKTIRQVAIKGTGRIQPALIITNDFDLTVERLIRKYTRRWLVEKTISSQIEFFHLNRVSSSMVIKVDFDLTMSILAHNLYRLMALDLERYEHCTPQTIYEKFIANSADIEIVDNLIQVHLKKKRTLPLTLQAMDKFKDQKYKWLANKKIQFLGASYS